LAQLATHVIAHPDFPCIRQALDTGCNVDPVAEEVPVRAFGNISDMEPDAKAGLPKSFRPRRSWESSRERTCRPHGKLGRLKLYQRAIAQKLDHPAAVSGNDILG
jgi:hypothetical protein